MPAQRNVKLKIFKPLAGFLGTDGTQFLQHGLGAIERILPHVECVGWRSLRSEKRDLVAQVVSPKTTRRELVFRFRPANAPVGIEVTVKRRKVPTVVRGHERTVDQTEKAICEQVVANLSHVLGPAPEKSTSVLRSLAADFDERVVSSYLEDKYGIPELPGGILRSLRGLSQQTYESKTLAFGCLLDGGNAEVPEGGARFPDDFLGPKQKRYRALSDGFKTAYLVSAKGAVLGFESLEDRSPGGKTFFPEWCGPLAYASQGSTLGFCLTRRGDILVFCDGSLRLSCRVGEWKYWNHNHLVHILHSAARGQRVPVKSVGSVARQLYRAALDVSFRRTGGLFLLLGKVAHLSTLVRGSDQIGGKGRNETNRQFDSALGQTTIQSISRSVIAELAALDGAIVMNNKGEILAYGAILKPPGKVQVGELEGSRTRAAKASSKLGLAVKVSSDGGISAYWQGTSLVET